jgi:sugar/nucleoside kinase (ribokinase family)
MAFQDRMNDIHDIAVAGEIFADHVLSGFARWPQPGEELFTDAYIREAGGGAAITACALAHLGRNTAVFGVIGQNDAWTQQRLQHFGVAVDALQLSADDTAVTISLSTREDRSFFTWPGANRHLPAYFADPAVQHRLAQSRHIHFATSIDRTLAQTLFPKLSAAGCTLSIDPGYRPEWLLSRENWQTCAECDFFFPNEKEGQFMTGHSQPEEILRTLHAAGIRGAILKLGREGAAALVNGRICRAAAPPVEAIDTTGAGDAFDAGFLDAILDHRSIPEAPISIALERGCFCGSLSTRQAGALAALPGREELNSLYEHTNHSNFQRP